MAEPRTFALDHGARLWWLELGTPTGPPMVLVPGLADGLSPVSEARARDAMPPLPRELRRYRVLVVSHRVPVTADVTTDALADDLATFLDAALDAPASVSGHSMGGMVAQHLAGARPDLVGRLVLSATVPSADGALRGRLSRWDDLLLAGRWRRFAREALEVSYTGSERLRRQLALRLTGVPALDHLVDRHLALSHACRTHDARDVLGAVTAPTLVLAGGADPLTRPHRAEELARAIPDARLLVLPGLAHGLAEQAGRRYVRHLVRFLELTDRQVA